MKSPVSILCSFFRAMTIIIHICVGTIEVIYESNVEDYGGPEEVAAPQPSTSNDPPAKKYRLKADFTPSWIKSNKIMYNIQPVHEPLKQTKQKPMLDAIGNATCVFF